MKAKRFRNSILSCLIAAMLVLGLGVGTFAAVEVPPAEMYAEKQMALIG